MATVLPISKFVQTSRATDVRVKTSATAFTGWAQLTAAAIAVWDRRTQTGFINPQFAALAHTFGGPANNIYNSEGYLIDMVTLIDPGKPIQYVQDVVNTTQLIFTGQDAQVNELLSSH